MKLSNRGRLELREAGIRRPLVVLTPDKFRMALNAYSGVSKSELVGKEDIEP